MPDNITKNLSDSEKLDFLINAVSDTNRRLGALEERQTDLEALVQNRLYDTRPLWEGVQQQFAEISARLQRHDEQFAQLQQRQDEQFAQMQNQIDTLRTEMRMGLRRVEKQIGAVSYGKLEFQTDIALLEDRVAALEKAA